MKKIVFMVIILMFSFSMFVFGQGNDVALGLNFMFMTPFDDFFAKDRFGLAISAEAITEIGYVNFSLNVLKNHNIWSGIIDLSIGYTSLYTSFGNPFWVGIYGGLGLGITFSEDWLAWKLNGGILIGLHYIFIRFDASYGTILGPTFGFSFGFLQRSKNYL